MQIPGTVIRHIMIHEEGDFYVLMKVLGKLCASNGTLSYSLKV